MRRDRPRYYRERNGNAFWEPGPRAADFGLPKSKALGPYGPTAMKAAIDWNAKLDAARGGTRPPPKYPPGTLGAFWELFRQTDAWAIMEPRTQEDYWRAWPAIEDRFAATLISDISSADSERFHRDLHPAHDNPARDPDGTMKLSWNEAHRTLKVWRALLSALVSYELREQAPVGRVSNPSPAGRAEMWTHEEISVLMWAALCLGLPGMAVAIQLAWDAMLSPVDVREAPLSAIARMPEGAALNWRRRKTGRRILTALDPFTVELVEAYSARQPVPLHGEARIVRRPTGAPYTDKDAFGDDFRLVRELAFPGDGRQLADIRRSAASEARRGGASRDDLGKAMANRLDANDALFDTYVVSASRRVQEARQRARKVG